MTISSFSPLLALSHAVRSYAGHHLKTKWSKSWFIWSNLCQFVGWSKGFGGRPTLPLHSIKCANPCCFDIFSLCGPTTRKVRRAYLIARVIAMGQKPSQSHQSNSIHRRFDWISSFPSVWVAAEVNKSDISVAVLVKWVRNKRRASTKFSPLSVSVYSLLNIQTDTVNLACIFRLALMFMFWTEKKSCNRRTFTFM